jgi:hypothetical protein
MAIMDMRRDLDNPTKGRRDWRWAIGEWAAQHSDSGTPDDGETGGSGGGAGDGEEGDTGDAGETGDDPDKDDDPEIGDDIDPERVRKLAADRRRKNRELIEERKNREKLEKRIAKYEEQERKRKEAEMSEKERAEARNEELEKQLAKEREAGAKRERLLAISKAGVDEAYQDTVELMLMNAQEEDEDLDAKEWLAKLAKDKPALMSSNGSGEPPPGAAGGPSRRGAPTTLQQLEKDLEACKDPDERFWIRRAIRKEKAQKGG